MTQYIKRVIDCTQPLYNNCPRWIGLPAMEISPHYYFLEQNSANGEYVKMLLHTGTHIDVPYHMIKGGKRIGNIALNQFMGEAIVIDATHRKDLLKIDLDYLRTRYDKKIKKGDIVIIYTGWGEKRGYNDEWLKNFPTLTTEAAKWIASKSVTGVAIDAIGFEAYSKDNMDLSVHHNLLNNVSFLAEEVYLPIEVLERERWWFIALPLRFDDAGGSPVRAALIEWAEN